MIVVGAGPAGASLAYLLADRGIEVALVERQRDFAREFRGEVLLPSGVDALEQMGLGEAYRRVPKWQPRSLTVYLNRKLVVDLALDPAFFGGHPPAAVSQPGLLEAIVAEAAARPAFRFLRGASVRELLRDGERISGVRIQTDEGSEELRAPLVVGADGRASIVRRRGGFAALENAPPMDIVWCKVPALPGLDGARGYAGGGHLLLVYRTFGDQLQVGWAILKGTFGELRRRGIEQWVGEMAEHVTPDLAEHLRRHAGALTHPFLLDVVSDRVTCWSAPGALLLGDAAHTMSPVGGQGLNLALRDAIVAANHLVPVLRAGRRRLGPRRRRARRRGRAAARDRDRPAPPGPGAAPRAEQRLVGRARAPPRAAPAAQRPREAAGGRDLAPLRLRRRAGPPDRLERGRT